MSIISGCKVTEFFVNCKLFPAFFPYAQQYCSANGPHAGHRRFAQGCQTNNSEPNYPIIVLCDAAGRCRTHPAPDPRRTDCNPPIDGGPTILLSRLRPAMDCAPSSYTCAHVYAHACSIIYKRNRRKYDLPNAIPISRQRIAVTIWQAPANPSSISVHIETVCWPHACACHNREPQSTTGRPSCRPHNGPRHYIRAFPR